MSDFPGAYYDAVERLLPRIINGNLCVSKRRPSKAVDKEMNQKPDYLNDCLTRLFRGEELENCLKDYPKEADELRPLLKLAMRIRIDAGTAELRPGFFVQTQAKLEATYRQKYHANTVSENKPSENKPV